MKKSGRKRKGITPKSMVVPAGFHPLSKKMAGVLVVMQEKFVNLPQWWYQGAQMRELAGEYYKGLRQVLRETSPSQRHLTRCCQCEIFF